MRFIKSVFVPLILSVISTAPATALTYTHSPGSPDTGPTAGQSDLIDFNGPIPEGYDLAGDFAYATGTSGAAASPALDGSRYLYTSSAIGSGTATLSTFDLSSVSFYWGSIDSYNSVDVLGAGGVTLLTLGGSAFSPANGDQGAAITNQRVSFTAEGSEVITGLRFTATGVAFEIDDIAGVLASGGSGSTVPEPATWALMIAGFGLVGVGARRRRETMNSVAA